jgi:hypothetical protein
MHGAPRAGPVRERRPVYVDLLPPCNAGCPAGENIQAWLGYMDAGRHEEAWRQLVADNPLPAIHGRVCYHPCESVCNRAELDSAVSIYSVERFLGDLALERRWLFDARRSARAGACWSSAPVRVGCPPPTISRGAATTSRSGDAGDDPSPLLSLDHARTTARGSWPLMTPRRRSSPQPERGRPPMDAPAARAKVGA